ncbi:MFS transporter [Acidimicrobiales bacterium]|nr:MFS transporter [Acidimicrobiales bacterium]
MASPFVILSHRTIVTSVWAMVEVIDERGTSRPLIPQTSVAAATWALFVGLALVMVGNGLNGSVLGVRSDEEGFSLGITGVIMAAYFAGFLLGTTYAERALKSVGHIRVFAALASAASSVVLLQALSVTPGTWMITRFLFGACMAGLYVIVESWLNDLATNRTRGRMLSVYMIVTMGGIAGGQLLLNVNDSSGFTLFIIVSVLVSFSLVPVTLSASSAPPVAVPEPMGLRALISRVPTGLVSSFFSGAGAGALLGMGAVYASQVGMSAGRISLFLAAPMIGALVFQWPIGWLSDHLPRRGVLFGVAVAATLAPLLALLVQDGSPVAIGAMFLMGGAMFPFYSLTVAYSNDWLKAEEILGASGTLVRVNGTGAIAGPLLAAGLMAGFGPRLFFWTITAIFASVSLFILVRIVSKDALPQERQRLHIYFPARASSVAANLIPRRRRNAAGIPEGRIVNR